MDKPTRHRTTKTKTDMKVTGKHRMVKVSITKKQFEDTLVKVFVQSVSGKPQEANQEGNRTSAGHPSDGCNETRKSQGKTEGKEG